LCSKSQVEPFFQSERKVFSSPWLRKARSRISWYCSERSHSRGIERRSGYSPPSPSCPFQDRSLPAPHPDVDTGVGGLARLLSHSMLRRNVSGVPMVSRAASTWLMSMSGS